METVPGTSVTEPSDINYHCPQNNWRIFLSQEDISMNFNDRLRIEKRCVKTRE